MTNELFLLSFFSLGFFLHIINIFLFIFEFPKNSRLLNNYINISANVFIVVTSLLKLLTENLSLEYNLYFSNFIGYLSIKIDNISAIFLIIIGIGHSLSVNYGTWFLTNFKQKHIMKSHYIFLSFIQISMILLLISNNILLFIFSWEIMSLSALFLSLFDYEKIEVIYSGIYYTIAMHISLLFLIIGFSLLTDYNVFNSTTFSQITNLNNENILAFVFLFIGFATKSGFFPLHTWLPKSDVVAPAHVSGIMSALTVKMGIYGILRTIELCAPKSANLAYFVLIVSVITMMWGILHALAQKDIKKSLAYSTIENMGIIGIAFSVILFGKVMNKENIIYLGYLIVFFHSFFHALAKNILFCLLGSIELVTHNRNMEKLGGIVHKMPFTTLNFIIASLILCALPPFGMFFSEFLSVWGLIEILQKLSNEAKLIIASGLFFLTLSGGLVIFNQSRIIGIAFLGLNRTKFIDNITEIPLHHNIIFLITSIILGLFGGLLFNFTNVNNINININEKLSDLMSINILFVIFSLILGIFVFVFYKKYKLYPCQTTWSCGYNNVTPKLQYTALSFVQNFRILVKLLTPEHVKKHISSDIFPKNSYFYLKIIDAIDAWFILPISNLFDKFLCLFHWIQSGSIKLYLLYEIIFLIVVIIWVLGVSV